MVVHQYTKAWEVAYPRHQRFPYPRSGIVVQGKKSLGFPYGLFRCFGVIAVHMHKSTSVAWCLLQGGGWRIGQHHLYTMPLAAEVVS